METAAPQATGLKSPIKRYIYGFFVGMVALSQLAQGSWLAALLAGAASVIVFPQTWRRAGMDNDPPPKLRRWTSIALAAASFISVGIAYQNSPEGKAAAAEQARAAELERQADAVEEKREALEEEGRRRTEAAKERRQALEEKAAAEKERRSGRHCISKWDGTHRAMAEGVTERLRNPSSFEHIDTVITPLDKKGHHDILMRYRAENGFGGMNVEMAIGVVNGADCHLISVTML